VLVSKTKSPGGKGANSPCIPDRDPTLKSPQRKLAASITDAYDAAGGAFNRDSEIPDWDPSLKGSAKKSASASSFKSAGGAAVDTASRDPEIPDWDPSLKGSPNKSSSVSSSRSAGGAAASADTASDIYDRLIGTPTKTTAIANVTLCKLVYKSPHTGRKLTHAIVLKGKVIITLFINVDIIFAFNFESLIITYRNRR
jgi:hypothetical protein